MAAQQTSDSVILFGANEPDERGRVLTQLAQFGGGFRDFAQGGVSEIK